MLKPSKNPDKIKKIGNHLQPLPASVSQAEETVLLYQRLLQTTALLNQKDREIEEFTYIASHDLKAPLRAIANLSQWLEDDLADKLPPENQEQLQLLRSRVQRMEILLDGLLAYSRAGCTQNVDELVDVGELIAQVIASLTPPANFTIEVKQGMPIFATKRSQLALVFSHLIGNAIAHHHRCNGQIQISVQDGGEFYEFSVSDDGPGIAWEYHEKIFGIFQTLKTHDQQENAGVGLSIVKKIVGTQGGKITLSSEPGSGSNFSFSWRK